MQSVLDGLAFGIGCVARANHAAISNFRKWEILFGGGFPFARALSREPGPAAARPLLTGLD
jgi:hypothetical protein